MGVCASRTAMGGRRRRRRRSYGDSSYSEKEAEKFILKMRELQQEVKAILKEREEESEAYESEMLSMAAKESEWKRERRKMREDVRILRKKLEDTREESTTSSMAVREISSSCSTVTIGRLLVNDREKREERARRDETVEKWKMLYLDVKNELDNLIHKTQQGTLCLWKAEEKELMEELQRELNAKDETIQALKEEIASMEDEEYRKNREVDILRQSLRIMSRKQTISPTSVLKSRSLHLTKNIVKLAFMS